MSTTLVDQMIERYRYPLLDIAAHDEFIAAHHEVILFFTEDPGRFPESNDVAMILPEINKAFAERFSIAVVSTPVQRTLQARYNFGQWPSLVFLRDGQYLGCISRVQDWADYLVQIESLLSSQSARTPGLGIPVAVEYPN